MNFKNSKIISKLNYNKMQNIPNFRNWLENLDEESRSWAPNQLHVVEHLLKTRQRRLSLQVIECLKSTLDHSENMERKWGVVKCSCNDNFCSNRKTCLSIIDINTQLGYK